MGRRGASRTAHDTFAGSGPRPPRGGRLARRKTIQIPQKSHRPTSPPRNLTTPTNPLSPRRRRGLTPNSTTRYTFTQARSLSIDSTSRHARAIKRAKGCSQPAQPQLLSPRRRLCHLDEGEAYLHFEKNQKLGS